MTKLATQVLSGEILGPRDGVRVVGMPHPFRADRYDEVLPAGLSVAEIISTASASYQGSWPRRIVVSVNGDPIPHEMWERVRVKKGATVTFRAVPEGGGEM